MKEHRGGGKHSDVVDGGNDRRQEEGDVDRRCLGKGLASRRGAKELVGVALICLHVMVDEVAGVGRQRSKDLIGQSSSRPH